MYHSDQGDEYKKCLLSREGSREMSGTWPCRPVAELHKGLLAGGKPHGEACKAVSLVQEFLFDRSNTAAAFQKNRCMSPGNLISHVGRLLRPHHIERE